jgi:peptidoglycan/LPS O-acetylase OafA/YrhL
MEFSRNGHFPALTGLRAIFVAMVVLHHAGLPLPAGIGVTGFFVLSGFLITSLLLKEFDQTQDLSLKGFYWRRSLRIFPAYYAFLALSIGADLVLGNEDIKPAILPGLLYLMNYYNALNDHPNISIAHAWSLAIEEQFYLLWPLLLLVILRKKRQALPWILGGLIVAVMLWRSYAWQAFGSSYVYNAFDTRCDSLAVGCLMGVLAPRLDGAAKALSKAWLVPVVVALIWASNLGAIRYTVGFTLGSVALAVLMMQVMTMRPRWLDSRPLVYIGTISYGLYLFHIFGLQVGHKLLDGMAGEVAGITFTFAIAALSYHLFEKPIMKFKHGSDRRRKNLARRDGEQRALVPIRPPR